MPGKNSGICVGCRGVGHSFGAYPIKRRCPDCQRGFQKIFIVERNSPNKGRFFKRCNHNCGFWEWCGEGEATGESSNTKVPLATQTAGESNDTRVPLATQTTQTEVDDMARKFESQLRINNDKELLISVNVTVTVRGEKPLTEIEMKGKEKA